MDVTRWIGLRSGAVTTGVLIVAAAGCAELRPTLGARTESAPTSSRTAAPIPAAEAQSGEEATLAAVEEFLDRTKQYEAGAAKPVDSQHSLSDEVAPAALRPEPLRARPAPDQAFANTQVTLADAPPVRPTLAIPAVESVSIRSSGSTSFPEPTSAVTHATNTSLDAREDDLFAASDRLLKSLEAEATRKHDFESEWRLRLTQLALDRQPNPPAVSTELAEPSRGLVLSFLEAARRIAAAGRDPQSAPQAALSAVEALRDALLERSDPTIRTVALCRKVVTFGVYDEMEPEDFVAGRSIQTIVYSELGNLRSAQNADGLLESRLATRLELLSAKGESVWQRDEPEVVDRCRRRRSDFFLAQRITLPPTLPAGDYTLKVSVEDRVAARADERAVNLAILAPVSVASKKTHTAP